MEIAMAVFDPNDWWEGNSWFQTRTKPKERRRPEEINQAVLTRWLGSVSLCLCFSVLAPAAHLAMTFGGLLIIAAVASACFAAFRHEPVHAAHLTAWDEAIWSCATGLILVLWTGTGPT
jgi:hypothetical protein